MTLPPPLQIPWKRKPVESAVSRSALLDDGRLVLEIEHELVRGVTPEMLAWWFRNLDGDMVYAGRVLPRYRVWHPEDHLSNRYVKRRRDGTVGRGARMHIREVLGRNPDYLIDATSTIARLDTTGFEHRPRPHGLPVAVMRYAFHRERDGTRYVNSLTVGFPGLLGKILNGLIRRFLFDEAQGQAWIKHNIEEVGNFEAFLPALYISEVDGVGTQSAG